MEQNKKKCKQFTLLYVICAVDIFFYKFNDVFSHTKKKLKSVDSLLSACKENKIQEKY